MQVCVYCASSAIINSAYFEATKALAKLFVEQDIKVVYGGGSSGLMGCLADEMLVRGGEVKGIMPKFMNEVEWAHKQLENLELTETMQERKTKFLEGTDAIVALPGGTGTLEELFEAMSFKRLGLFTKPILILNTAGFYDPLLDMLERMVEQGFMNEEHRQLYTVFSEPEKFNQALEQAQPWSSEAIKFASARIGNEQA